MYRIVELLQTYCCRDIVKWYMILKKNMILHSPGPFRCRISSGLFVGYVAGQVWRRFGIDYETCLSLDPKGPRVDPCEQVGGSINS